MSELRNAAQISELQKQAFDLRLQGLSYSAIGERLGISEMYSCKLVTRVLNDRPVENLETVREVEIARLDRLLARLNSELEMFKIVPKDHADLILKVSARRAALLGLDAPTKLAVQTQQKVAPVQLAALSDEKLAALSQIASAMKAATAPALPAPQDVEDAQLVS